MITSEGTEAMINGCGHNAEEGEMEYRSCKSNDSPAGYRATPVFFSS